MAPGDSTPASWGRFLAGLAAGLVALSAAILAFALVFDPFGVGPFARRDRPVLMDLNQRYMYPQLVRSGRFDAALVGTSTVRLLDPESLDGPLGARFVNLAMNSATPWEQTRILDLFLRHTPAPKGLVWGLDPLWCESDATGPAKRLTPRPFPDTFYDENPWNDWPELFNLKSLEIAWRMLMYRIGAMPERYRIDGYEVFTPPEATYDLARARGHLWGGPTPRPIAPQSPAFVATQAQEASWDTPALPWLDELLARVPPGTPVALVFPPNHVSVQPIPGSEAEARARVCKDRIRTIAEARGVALLDFQRQSPVTLDDSAYWDPLHYRLPVARRIEAAILGILAPVDRRPPADPRPFWTVLAGGKARQ